MLTTKLVSPDVFEILLDGVPIGTMKQQWTATIRVPHLCTPHYYASSTYVGETPEAALGHVQQFLDVDAPAHEAKLFP